MPEIWAGELGELRSISTADGGTALSTTATYIQFPALAKAGDKKKAHLFITPRNFATAVTAKYLLNPWLTVLKTTDGVATVPVDYSIEAQDSSTSTSVTLSSMPLYSTTGGFVLIGSHEKFGGAYFDMDGTNSTASTVLSVYYRNTVGWADTSATVSGVTSSVAFDQDGLVYWTVPSDWTSAKLKDIYPITAGKYYAEIPLFWTQWRCTHVMDTSVTVDAITAYNRSTTYSEWLEGQVFEEKMEYGFGGFGCIQAIVGAGTANLIVNVAQVKDGGF